MSNKRKKNDTHDFRARPIKRSRSEPRTTSTEGWAVRVTQYVDDYKPRGRDMCRVLFSGYYRHLRNARESLRQQLMEVCEDQRQGRELESHEKQDLEDMTLEELEEEAWRYGKGSYVDQRIVWSLHRVEYLDD
jgi:hypothetical protein